MKKPLPFILRQLALSTLAGLFFGLFFGYLTGRPWETLLHALSIVYCIGILNSLVHFFVLPKVSHLPRLKRIGSEVIGFFIASLLGFFIPIAIFSRIFKFDFYVTRIIIANIGLLILLYAMASGITYAFRFYRELKQKEADTERSRALAAEARIQALQSQVNPHFLFNALHAINALVVKNPDAARKMISRLSFLLRMSLESQENAMVSFQREWDCACAYFEIEKVRFEDKLMLCQDIGTNVMEASFPVMILQPLLENAVKHGMAGSSHHVEIHLICRINDHHLECTLTNTVSKTNNRSKKTAGGHGNSLESIRQRLRLLFGADHTFNADFPNENHFRIFLAIPYERIKKK